MRASQVPWITVGVGKSHIAQALAHLAIRAGAEARFLKTSRALAHLAGGHADRTWDKRLAELTRPAVLILDDFAIRELTAAQADDLYELITSDAEVLIGVLAILEGAIWSGGDLDEWTASKVAERFVQQGLLAAGRDQRDPRQAINDMNHQLRLPPGSTTARRHRSRCRREQPGVTGCAHAFYTHSNRDVDT